MTHKDPRRPGTSEGRTQAEGEPPLKRIKQQIRSYWNTFYKYCYITGINLIRKKRHFLKRARPRLAALWQKGKTSLIGLIRKLKSLGTKSRQELAQPVRQGFEWTLEQEQKLLEAGREGSLGSYLFACVKRSAQGVLSGAWNMRNYVLPAAAMVLFLGTFAYVRTLTFALSVSYAGEHIGYVADESVFDNAEAQVKKRIMFESYILPEDAVPTFTLTVVDEALLTGLDELTDSIIRASGNELTEGHGLYIENQFYGVVEDGEAVTQLLESIKDQYRTGDPDEVVEFVKQVEVKEGLYPVTSIVSASSLRSKVDREETQEETYIVQALDVPSTIAEKYNMAYSDLKQLNPDIESRLLVGQEVLIHKAVPVLEVQVTKTEVYNEDVPFQVIQVQDDSQMQGYTKVRQTGQLGTNQVTAKVTYIDGVEVNRDIISTTVLKAPVDEEMVVGGSMPLRQLPASTLTTDTNFIWPVDGGYLTAGFYGYAGHTGMDIATKAGTAIRASASGTVELAQYYTGNAYGKYVIIDHGGGVKTLYAHCSELYVQVGQWVEQGELIAAVGMTGNADGTHCHFEIRINGTHQNPVHYIGSNYNR